MPQWGTESAWSRSGLPSTGENETKDLRKCSLSTGCRAQDRGGETETVGFLQLGEERTQKGLSAVCKYLKEQCRAARTRLLSEVHSESTRGSIHTQKHKKFHCSGGGQIRSLLEWSKTDADCSERLGRCSELGWTWSWSPVPPKHALSRMLDQKTSGPFQPKLY